MPLLMGFGSGPIVRGLDYPYAGMNSEPKRSIAFRRCSDLQPVRLDVNGPMRLKISSLRTALSPFTHIRGGKKGLIRT
jgi:hypothetical protein